MNITEANALNTLLDYLGIRVSYARYDPSPNPIRRAEQTRQARDAAAILADRASKALSAGRRRADVERDWPVVAATLEAGRAAGG